MAIRYLALLRGINVGGNNVIKMSDLKSAFEAMGLSDVKTYIQSGNVVFSSERTNKAELTDEIEKKLSRLFDYDSVVLLLTKEELMRKLSSAPEHYGTDNMNYRYDVIFIKETTTAENVLRNIQLRDGIDEAFIGDNILFFRRLFVDLTKSKLTKIVTSPVYKQITIRNWKTSSKLLDMMRS